MWRNIIEEVEENSEVKDVIDMFYDVYVISFDQDNCGGLNQVICYVRNEVLNNEKLEIKVICGKSNFVVCYIQDCCNVEDYEDEVYY